MVPVTLLPAGTTLEKARAELQRSETWYGVFLDKNQNPLALVTREQLATIKSSNEIAHDVPLLIVNANTSLGQLADFAEILHGQDGVLVRESGSIIGVLETPHIVRGGELAGNPVTPFLYWICPKCRNEQPVLEYRRSDPPRCPKDGTKLAPPR